LKVSEYLNKQSECSDCNIEQEFIIKGSLKIITVHCKNCKEEHKKIKEYYQSRLF